MRYDLEVVEDGQLHEQKRHVYKARSRRELGDARSTLHISRSLPTSECQIYAYRSAY